MPEPPITVRTLSDGGQRANAIADRLEPWLGDAQSSPDLALYDVRLPGEIGDRVAGAIRAAQALGVKVRIAYNPKRAWFSPGHRPELSHRIAKRIGAARRRVRIASPVLTAGRSSARSTR